MDCSTWGFRTVVNLRLRKLVLYSLASTLQVSDTPWTATSRCSQMIQLSLDMYLRGTIWSKGRSLSTLSSCLNSISGENHHPSQHLWFGHPGGRHVQIIASSWQYTGLLSKHSCSIPKGPSAGQAEVFWGVQNTTMLASGCLLCGRLLGRWRHM